MTMQLKKATRKAVKLKLNLSAPSGAGKTMSALRMAKGIVGSWDKIAVIDTENGSASLYSHLGDFNTIDLQPPFTPEKYSEALKLCVDAGMEVVIIDSTSHEWSTLIEENQKLTSAIDVTPFIIYFAENVYGKFEKQEISVDVFDLFKQALEKGEVTAKEEQLWQFVVANYGTSPFSTKQLEKDCGNAAYATIRAFVLKFEQLGLLSSKKLKNRTRYRIIKSKREF